jgi:hypothetical protein
VTIDGHRIGGVRGDVEDDLLDRRGVDDDRRQRLVAFRDRDPTPLHEDADEVDRLANDVRKVGVGERGRVRPGEVDEAADDRPRPECLLADRLEVAPQGILGAEL